jgi:hypothetical protein
MLQPSQGLDTVSTQNLAAQLLGAHFEAFSKTSGPGVALQLLGEGPHAFGVVPSRPRQARLQEAGFQEERAVGEAAAFGGGLVEPPLRVRPALRAEIVIRPRQGELDAGVGSRGTIGSRAARSSQEDALRGEPASFQQRALQIHTSGAF